MTTVAAGSLDTRGDGASPPSGAFLISIPDAERLLLQSRFVKNQLEAQILKELEVRIRTATRLDPAAVPQDLVTMNSRIRLRDKDGTRQMIFTLVFPSCPNHRKGTVSVLTPLGSILLGARIGQVLTCPISGQISTVVVEAILHQPEASGDYYG